ncbi:MAG: condensation domain-containing protein [Rubripirellula sp.]|nr:condensation domain-containing protein [Rubripirellula sp.]
MTGHDALSGLTEEQQRKLLRVLLEKRAADDAVFPMSIQQRSLWFEYQRDPSWPGFNVCLPSRVRSKLDVDLFHRAMDCLVERHASLRTVFGNRGGEPFQRVQARQPPEFCVVDASEESEDALQELAASESVRPFDLESGPLLRIILFRRAEDDWILIATTHHLVIDFWSLVLLLGEVRILYRDLVAGREISLPTSPNNYASFVQRQRDLLQNSGGEKLRRYWRKQLRETAWFTEFPTDYVRPRRFTGRAASVAIDIPARNVERVAALARSEGVTFPSVLLAILQVFVHRYTGESRFLIGSPFSGRLLREYEETVGFFVNMLPLRANITSETTFAELVGQAGSVFAEALEHEALPLAEIIRDSKAPSDPSRPPLFQVAFTFEKSHRKEEDGRAGYLLGGEKQQTNLGGLEQQSFPVPVQTCHYDLEFIFERNGPTLNAMLCYCRDLFATDSINAFVKNFRSLTEELLNHPIRPIGDLGWSVSNEDKTSNDPRRPRTAGTRGSVSNADTGTAEAEDEQPIVFDGDRHSASAGVTQTFDESPWIFSAIQNVAVNDPQRMALWSGDYRKSYAELVRESLQIAGALAGRGIAANRYVPVVGARGPRVIPAILGVIAAGAVVVPIDAEEPAVSPEELLADTGAKLVIVETDGQWTMSEQASPNDVEVRTIEELLGEQVDHVCETIEPRGDDLCYLIYTSGSSGRPKGVMIEHQAIDNTLRWRKETVPLGAEDRILVLLSHQFDAGFGVMFGSLVQGARLVWPTASRVHSREYYQSVDYGLADDSLAVGADRWSPLV